MIVVQGTVAAESQPYTHHMSRLAKSYSTSWMHGRDLDEILNWVGDKALEGFELKSMTATTAPQTTFDPRLGRQVEMWSAYYVAVVQKPET